ncbi:MAG: YidC/Oxa1 family membrane protein insertase [Clostridiaceae bacterium]|nr:YidC/Oxa1 family membrane protein insertase [Clostridiaceae bacterium]
MLDPIAKVLGVVLKFIYDNAFQNYGLAIIIFTILVRLAMLPLTLKQQKSSAKMQEIQPLLNDLQKRYKDDKEKLNQEMMKLYQEHNYNPASGCLPLLIQMPILLTLYWVIAQPLKFMLGKTEEARTAIINVAAKAQVAINALLNDPKIPTTVEDVVKSWGTYSEIKALNYFNENPEALSQVTGFLDKTELIDFKSFLGLHLGEIANPTALFSDFQNTWKIQLPILILVLLATVTTYLSSKLAMPKTTTQQSGAAGCSTNSMLYMGPVMTLMFSFRLPAGVILYWMAGYVFAIFQQLYLNKQRDKAAALREAAEKEKAARAAEENAQKEEENGTIEGETQKADKQLPSGGSKSSGKGGSKGGSKGKGKKGGSKKGGKKK